MKALLYTILNLISVASVLSKPDGVRGFIRNVQVADGSSFFFPGFSTPSPQTEIPLELVMKLNEVDDMREFIQKFVYLDNHNVTTSSMSPLLGHEGIERSVPRMSLKAAECKPESRTVSVPPDENTHLFYYPSCVRVERCGGCCIHNLLVCTPIESEIVNVQVFVGEYTGGSKIQYKYLRLVPVEQHTKCKCLCRTRPQDCNKFQKYNKDTCSCDCSNPDAEIKCHEDRKNKIWSKDRCSCVCKEEMECSTGFYYDPVSCRCEVQGGRIRPSPRPWIA